MAPNEQTYPSLALPSGKDQTCYCPGNYSSTYQICAVLVVAQNEQNEGDITSVIHRKTGEYNHQHNFNSSLPDLLGDNSRRVLGMSTSCRSKLCGIQQVQRGSANPWTHWEDDYHGIWSLSKMDCYLTVDTLVKKMDFLAASVLNLCCHVLYKKSEGHIQ